MSVINKKKILPVSDLKQLKADQESYHRDLFTKCLETLGSKKNDYSNKDEFSNFLTSSMIAGTIPEQSFLTLIGTKVARLRELTTTDKEVKNESVQDTILDLVCYTSLLGKYLKFRKQDKNIRQLNADLIEHFMVGGTLIEINDRIEELLNG